MSTVRTKLDKADARRAFVAHQFAPSTLDDVFERLRSVQFDPLSPVGCNHDLVLQARVEGYKVGDWQKAAYDGRLVYDGWDKMACLVPFSGWGVRRIFHHWTAGHFKKIFNEYSHAVDAVLGELAERGPLAPKEFTFQEHKPEWRGSWHGPNLTKQTLRALWHTGKVMTHSRRGQHHVYDLTERIVPAVYLTEPPVGEKDAVKAILLDRHEAMGLLRPTASFEVWSIQPAWYDRRGTIAQLVNEGKLTELEIDGVVANAAPACLTALDSIAEPRVRFVGPLDQFMWDRKMVAHLFGFDYCWEVYKPEPLRTWGYYVLPVLFGDRVVARVDPWCRNGVLEFKSWHWEPGEPSSPLFWDAFDEALIRFMAYCGAKSVKCERTVDKAVKEAAKRAGRAA